MADFHAFFRAPEADENGAAWFELEGSPFQNMNEAQDACKAHVLARQKSGTYLIANGPSMFEGKLTETVDLDPV